MRRRARRDDRCRRGWCTGRTAIGVRDQSRIRSAQAVRHLERVEHQPAAQVSRELPPDDHPAVTVEDEGQVDEAVPGPHVGDVGDPLLVWPRRREVPLQKVAGPLERGLVRDRRVPLLPALDAFQPLGARQPRAAVATDVDVAALQLLPGLADAVYAPVALPGSVDLGDERLLFERAAGRLPGPARVVRAHRHADRAADRLDPESIPPLLRVAAHLRRVGSSSVAKYTDASFKIAFARFSSAFSFRSRFSSSRSSDVSSSRRRPLSAPPVAPRSAATHGGCRDPAPPAGPAGPTRTPAALLAPSIPTDTSSRLPSPEHLLPPGRRLVQEPPRNSACFRGRHAHSRSRSQAPQRRPGPIAAPRATAHPDNDQGPIAPQSFRIETSYPTHSRPVIRQRFPVAAAAFARRLEQRSADGAKDVPTNSPRRRTSTRSTPPLRSASHPSDIESPSLAPSWSTQ